MKFPPPTASVTYPPPLAPPASTRGGVAGAQTQNSKNGAGAAAENSETRSGRVLAGGEKGLQAPAFPSDEVPHLVAHAQRISNACVNV